jgi:hypothetical protein
MEKLRPWLPSMSLVLLLGICVMEQYLLRSPDVEGGSEQRAVRPVTGPGMDLESFGELLTLEGIQRGLTALVAEGGAPSRPRVVARSAGELARVAGARERVERELVELDGRMAGLLERIVSVLDKEQREQLIEFRNERRQEERVSLRIQDALEALEGEAGP